MDQMPKPMFEINELAYKKPESMTFKINNFTLLLEKIGSNIYSENPDMESIKPVIS